MQYLKKLTVVFILVFFILPVITLAQSKTEAGNGPYSSTCTGNGFCSLADYSKSELGSIYSTQSGDFATFFNKIVIFLFSIAAMASVIQVVRGGYLYGMGDTLGAGSMQKAKEIWANVAIGFLLMLSLWLILHTINPELLNIKIPKLNTGITPPPPVADIPTVSPEEKAKDTLTENLNQYAIQEAEKKHDPATLVEKNNTPLTLNIPFGTELYGPNGSIEKFKAFTKECSSLGGTPNKDGNVYTCIKP